MRTVLCSMEMYLYVVEMHVVDSVVDNVVGLLVKVIFKVRSMT